MIKDKLSAVNDYNADSIKALEGLEAVRKRPAMYIGNTNSTGLAHIVFEIFDNAVDEVLADFADTIELTFHEDGSVSIEDNGRGIPPEALELIFTTLHAGGKFDSSNYKSSGGLHGVGTSVTNAMSEWLEVTVYRNGKQHYLKFENGGHPIGKMKVIGTCDKNKTGTLVRFKPDASLFSTVKFNVERIEQRARETAFLNPKVKIIFNDFRSDDEELRFTNIFDYNGMGDYLTYLADNSTISIAPKEFTMLDEPTGIEATIAFQWVENDEASQENILSYVNNIRTRDGGTHETGFKTGLTKAFNQFGKDAGLLKGKYSKVLGEDIRDGMIAVISTKIPENILEFESQTKDKLGSIEARSVLEGFAYDIFIKFLSMNKSDAEYLIDRAIKYQKMKEEAKRLRDTAKKTNNKSKKLSMSDKLTEPSVKNYKRNELFIVEGDSAGGCHTIDTPIMLANNTVKTIGELLEDFNNGIDNYVYGFDNEHKKEFNVYKILDVFKTKTTKVIRLTFDDGSQVRVTPEHKYLLKNGEWKEAQNLKPTDSLRSLYLLKNGTLDVNQLSNTQLNREESQHNHRVVKIEWLDDEVDVYDLTVDGVHNFALGNGVIVHNSAKNGRYKEFQGVLSLRGKVLNTIDSTHTEALTNAEIQTIVAALNCGMGNDYNEDDLHYDKVIIMTDADVDGSHIQVLLLTFFYKHMRKLIEDGHVYISSPPLYGITLNPKDKKPEKRYAWNQTELREILETAPKGSQVQRYKGLGEMGDVDIRDTTLNPEHRVLYKIEISDFIQANNTLNTLMGRDASKRRIWIEQNVEFLDDSDTYEFKEADYSLEDL